MADPTSRSTRARVGDDGAEELHVPGGDPQEHLRRGVVAQGLFHPLRGTPRLGQGLGLLVREPPGPVPGVGEQLGGGLVARHHDEEEKGDDLVVGQPVPVDVDVEQARGEVVAPGPSALDDHVGEVPGQDERRLHPLLGHVEDALVAVDEEIGEASDLGPVGLGYADHLRDHVHGELARHVAHHVEGARFDGGVEVSHGQGADLRFELGHPARREGLGDERAHAGVAGWVHGQERHRLVGLGPVGGGIESDAEAVGEVGGVAEGGQDVGMARQRPEVELVVAVERGLGAQPRVGRVGVLVDLVVVRAVVHGRRVGVECGHDAPRSTSRAASASASGTSSKRMWPMPAHSIAPL